MIIDKIEVTPYTLDFKFAAGTSRGKLHHKKTSFVKVYSGKQEGLGEAGPLVKLSLDDLEDFHLVFENVLQGFVGKSFSSMADVNTHIKQIPDKYPSLRFAFETALLGLLNGNKDCVYNNDFYKGKEGIHINGLIWMGEKEFMLQQIKDKIEQGFTCVKMKVGAIDFETELTLLKYIRDEYTSDDITLRVDANGAFSPSEALEKLKRFSEFDLHSIEQPIKQGQYEAMANLCERTPLDIALDEELIGVVGGDRLKMLEVINPQYIIIKPTLVGGLQDTQEWVDYAESCNVKWWITSALESNIGLNAIAQYTYQTGNKMPQGLGTGQLYHNNIESPLTIKGEELWYDTDK